MEMYLLASLFIAFCQFLYNFFAGINTFNQTGNITYCKRFPNPDYYFPSYFLLNLPNHIA